MKQLFFLLIAPLLAFTSFKPVTINGHLEKSDDVEMIFLSFRSAGAQVSDSARLTNGNFAFDIQVEEPTLAYLTLRFRKTEGRPRYEKIPLFIEPGHITIEAKDSLKTARIRGSKSNTEFTAFTALQKTYTEQNRALYQQYIQYRKDGNKEEMKRAEEAMEALDQKLKEEVYYPYLKHHPASPIAVHVLREYAGYDIDVTKVEPLLASLPVSRQQWPSYIELKNQVEVAKKTGVGVYAMDFTQQDTLDKAVSLSDFKGRYVLLDFWASWCGPCRAENPNVVKAFNQYKDRNFTVLSVSLDRPGKKQAWLDAIHKDGLTWTHVSDLNYWDNAVAKLYGIRAIPQNLLIDPQGKIIAKNVTGEALDQQLEKVLGK
ncbi:MAG: redoxin domain-containing protein [Flavisolibacter sp.]